VFALCWWSVAQCVRVPIDIPKVVGVEFRRRDGDCKVGATALVGGIYSGTTGWVVIGDVLLHLIVDIGANALGRVVQLTRKTTRARDLLLDVVELNDAFATRIEVFASVDFTVLGDQHLFQPMPQRSTSESHHRHRRKQQQWQEQVSSTKKTVVASRNRGCTYLVTTIGRNDLEHLVSVPLSECRLGRIVEKRVVGQKATDI
jgi:hypothetical protein